MHRRTFVIVAACVGLAAACGSGQRQSVAQAAAPPTEHEHHAPHGGTLVELGDEFAHVELVFDRSDSRLTAYVLDGEAEQPIRLTDRAIDIFIENVPGLGNRTIGLAGVADVLTGETERNTSQYTVTVLAFKQVPLLAGRIPSLTVRGQRFQDLRFQVPASGG